MVKVASCSLMIVDLTDSFHPDQASADVAVQNMEDCCRAIKTWMSLNKLKLNDEKTEAIFCGSKAQREKVSGDAACVGDSKISLSSTVRDLGLIIDANVTMKGHISNTVRCYFYHLRSTGMLRHFLTAKAANAIAVSVVLSRLVYCNSCLWGIRNQQLRRLQLDQNTAARIITRTRKREHITPALKELHWFSVKPRIDHDVLDVQML